KFPSPRAPVSVGLGQRPRDGLVGELEPPALLAPVAARQLENLSVPALDDNAAFDACHTRSLPKDRGRGQRYGSSRSRRGGEVRGIDRPSTPERALPLRPLVDHQMPAELTSSEEPLPARDANPFRRALVGPELTHAFAPSVLFGRQDHDHVAPFHQWVPLND